MSKRQKTTLIILAVATLLGVVGYQVWQKSQFTVEKKPTGFDRTLNLAFQDYSGQERVLANHLADGPIVINAWATWCPFCTKELGDFAAVQDRFKGKVTFIAINRGESVATAKNFTDKTGVTNRMVFLMDPNDNFYKEIGGFSMPETLFITKSGSILEHKRGPLTEEEIMQKTKQLVEG